MITSDKIDKEAKQIPGTNQIILTLKQNPGSRHVSAVIKHIGSDRDVKVLNGKIIDINGKHWEPGSKNCHSFSFKEMHSLDKPEDVDVALPKITQICTKNTSASKRRQTSVLNKNLLLEKKLLLKCTDLLRGRQRTRRNIKKSARTKLKNMNNENSNLSKNHRFIPNILRNPKPDEELLQNNEASIGFRSLLATRMKEIKTSSEGLHVGKRKRKQTLMSEELEHNYLEENEGLHTENEPNYLSPNCSEERNLDEENDFLILNANASDEELGSIDEAPAESHLESSETAQDELTIKSFDCNSNDLDEASTEIPYPSINSSSIDETLCTDKSVQQILDEFKEPDYINYIVSEDFCFDEINEMDRLLSSTNESLHKEESPLVNNCTKTVEYDMNGNDIENWGKAMGIISDKDHWKTSNFQWEIDQYHHKKDADLSTDLPESKHDINLDKICSKTLNKVEDLFPSPAELCINEFEDYFYPSDDLDEFQRNIEQLSSLLDTTSESENNDASCPEITSIDLLKEKNLDYSAISLAPVSDVVPFDVLSCGSEELDSGSMKFQENAMKQLSDSEQTLQQNDLNTIDNSDEINHALSGANQEFTTDHQLLDNSNVNLGFIGEIEYMADDKLNIDRVISNGNEMYKIKAEDAEISKYFGSDDNFDNRCESPPDIQLPLYELDVLEKKLSLGLEYQLDTSNICDLEPSSLLFTDIEIDNSEEASADNNSQAIHDLESKFSSESEAETKELESRCGNRNSDLFNSENSSSSYVDDMESCSRCSPPLFLKKKLCKLEMSKLKDMLTREKTYNDYSNTFSAVSVSQNVTKDLRIANNNVESFKNKDISDNKIYSQVKGCSEVVNFAPKTSRKNWHSKEFAYRKIELIPHNQLLQEKNIGGPEPAAISNESLLNSQKNHWPGLDSPCDKSSIDCKL